MVAGNPHVMVAGNSSAAAVAAAMVPSLDVEEEIQVEADRPRPPRTVDTAAGKA